MSPILVTFVIAFGYWTIKHILTPKTVFVSYDYNADAKYKNLLVAWSANRAFSLDFGDASADISIQSNNEGVIRRAISAKIHRADVLLCIVGEHTHERPMVRWEIQKAVELGKPIIATKITRSSKSPDVLKGVGAKWVSSFKHDSILRALQEVM